MGLAKTKLKIEEMNEQSFNCFVSESTGTYRSWVLGLEEAGSGTVIPESSC